MRRWVAILLLGLLPLIAMAQPDVSKYGGRPENGIHDPGDRLSVQGKTLLANDLKAIREGAGLDILAVVLTDSLNAEPQEIADELANQWGYHGGRALVLWIPGNEDGPWISVSGLIRSEMSDKTLADFTARAKSRAKTEETPEAGIRQAVASLGEDLRFLGGRAARASQAEKKAPRLRTQDLLLLLLLGSKKIILVTVGGLLVGGFVIFHAYRYFRKARFALTPKTFPDVAWKRRFGAPHAGIVYTHSKKPHAHPNANDIH